MSLSETVKLVNRIIDWVTQLVKLVKRKMLKRDISEAIEKSNEGDQRKLEELTGDSGRPTRHDYPGMYVRKAKKKKR